MILFSRQIVALLILNFIILAGSPIVSYAQTENKVRPIVSESVAETGCPVQISQSRVELDVDPFETVVDARIYIGYKNLGTNPITAVKFRARFVGDQGKELNTFLASDVFALAPGQERSQKWRTDKVDPTSQGLRIRVLQAKFQDGSVWESEKLKDPPQ